MLRKVRSLSQDALQVFVLVTVTSTHINTQKLVFDANYAYKIIISVKIVYYIFYSRNVEVPIVFHIIFLIYSFHPVVLLFLHVNLVLAFDNLWFVFRDLGASTELNTCNTFHYIVFVYYLSHYYMINMTL